MRIAGIEMGGYSDDEESEFGMDEDRIPGDNDKQGDAQIPSGTNNPANKDAPENLTRIVAEPGDGNAGSVNIQIDDPANAPQTPSLV